MQDNVVIRMRIEKRQLLLVLATAKRKDFQSQEVTNSITLQLLAVNIEWRQDMTKRDTILGAEVRRMLEYVRKEQATNCYSDETMELHSNLRCLLLEVDGELSNDLRELSGYMMGSAYYDGFIRGIRAGISLANSITGV